MTYEELGAIEDPTDLTNIGCLSPMLVAYVVRTEQLHSRFAGVAFRDLLNAINNAVTMIPWSAEAVQQAVAEERNPDVDAYLDHLHVFISAALRPH
ncbi:hypothetical protein [Pandoraea sputorum]|uniref:hypothetical protein n=1 Tax=Pandoraea sputorum TaxID=93222 RepID=UPI0012414A85|nr:hypothetical protein [Pandoraea sputorum]VVE59248.1 hypothetical protein PSP20601_05481 [Pandoraea sputorum]